MSEIKSFLRLDRLVFDKISFDRVGFKNKNQLTHSLEARFAQNSKDNMYRVTMVLKGEKKDEYTFEISLTGFFSFNSEEKIDEKLKNNLISKNTIAIMMPYLRSQLSLLTAQPEVDCVVLPPFNINKMMEEK